MLFASVTKSFFLQKNFIKKIIIFNQINIKRKTNFKKPLFGPSGLTPLGEYPKDKDFFGGSPLELSLDGYPLRQGFYKTITKLQLNFFYPKGLFLRYLGFI